MDKETKILIFFYWLTIAFGAYRTLFSTVFVSILATDAPSSTMLHAILGGILGFSVVFLPFVLLPFLAIRELKNYAEKKKLIFNKILSVTLFILLSIQIIGSAKMMLTLIKLNQLAINYAIMSLTSLLFGLIILILQVRTIRKLKMQKDVINYAS